MTGTIASTSSVSGLPTELMSSARRSTRRSGRKSSHSQARRRRRRSRAARRAVKATSGSASACEIPRARRSRRPSGATGVGCRANTAYSLSPPSASQPAPPTRPIRRLPSPRLKKHVCANFWTWWYD